MFLTILHVIQDRQFMSTLYPEDQCTMIEMRIRHLVDMYLNMPDKAMFESPLHCACKYGSESIVAIILSYPECSILLRNKYGLFAKDVICQRYMCHSEDLKKRILNMFKELFYVPVIRDGLHTFVGQPCDSTTVLVATSSHHTKEGSSATYCAFAGPMTLSEAMSFYTLLTTKGFAEKEEAQKISFSSDDKEMLLKIGLANSKKKLERVGRKFASKLSVTWLEYWSILDVWFDLSSSGGLEYFNNHLKKQEDLVYNKQIGSRPFRNFIIDFVEAFFKKISEVVISRSQMYFFHLLQSVVQHMDCFIYYSYSTEMELAYIHKEIGHLLYLKLTDDNHANLMNFHALKFFLVSQSFTFACFEKLKWRMLTCILKFAFYFQTSRGVSVNEPCCTCVYVQDDDCFVYSAKSCYYSIISLRQELIKDFVLKYAAETTSSVVDMEQGSVSGPSEGTGATLSYVGRATKYRITENLKSSYLKAKFETSADACAFSSLPNSLIDTEKVVFFQGEKMSNVDIEVYHAIQDAGVLINIFEYPYLSKWKNLMECKLGASLKLDNEISCTPSSSAAGHNKFSYLQ